MLKWRKEHNKGKSGALVKGLFSKSSAFCVKEAAGRRSARPATIPWDEP